MVSRDPARGAVGRDLRGFGQWDVVNSPVLGLSETVKMDRKNRIAGVNG